MLPVYATTEKTKDVSAQEVQGKEYEEALPFAKDSKEEFAWCQERARQGDPQAQCRLGMMYIEEMVVDEDYDYAAVCFSRAAEQGNAEAQYQLALLYADGEGVEQNDILHRYWLIQAAEQGHVRAQYDLGYSYDLGLTGLSHHGLALKWYRKAAAQGDADAQYRLGEKFRYGGKGIERDYAQAMQWYRKAASQGHEEAQAKLAYMYKYGLGVRKNNKQATYWHKKALEQNPFILLTPDLNDTFKREYGADRQVPSYMTEEFLPKVTVPKDAEEQYQLGKKLEGARYCDYRTSIALYKEAAKQGHSEAQYTLGVLSQNGCGFVRDGLQAAYWFEKAARQGHAQAQAALGYIYWCGDIDLPANATLALPWVRQAAQQGIHSAQELLERISQSLRLINDQKLDVSKLARAFASDTMQEYEHQEDECDLSNTMRP